MRLYLKSTAGSSKSALCSETAFLNFFRDCNMFVNDEKSVGGSEYSPHSNHKTNLQQHENWPGKKPQATGFWHPASSAAPPPGRDLLVGQQLDWLSENKSNVHCHINKFYEKLFFNRTIRIRERVFDVATNTLATSSASLSVNWVADSKIWPEYKANSRRSIIGPRIGNHLVSLQKLKRTM